MSQTNSYISQNSRRPVLSNQNGSLYNNQIKQKMNISHKNQCQKLRQALQETLDQNDLLRENNQQLQTKIIQLESLLCEAENEIYNKEEKIKMLQCQYLLRKNTTSIKSKCKDSRRRSISC